MNWYFNTGVKRRTYKLISETIFPLGMFIRKHTAYTRDKNVGNEKGVAIPIYNARIKYTHIYIYIYQLPHYHTTQVLSISKRIRCKSTGLIYLAECITCESSCVGYSISNLPKRFFNQAISNILNVMSNHVDVGLPIIFLKKIMIWLGIKIKRNFICHLLSM